MRKPPSGVAGRRVPHVEYGPEGWNRVQGKGIRAGGCKKCEEARDWEHERRRDPPSSDAEAVLGR